MLTNRDAVANLKSRDEFLQRKIAEAESEGKRTYFYERDREALALAIAALEFTIATLEYEASQKTL